MDMDSPDRTSLLCLVVVLWMCGCLLPTATAGATTATSDVYMVLVRGIPVVHHDGLPCRLDGRVDMSSEVTQQYASRLIQQHDLLLETSLTKGEYTKLYSYHYLVNGFAAWLTSEQAAVLRELPEVVLVERDRKVQKSTTYTPTFLGLPDGAWAESGGLDYAGDGIVIGIVDTGLDPTHPSFSDQSPYYPYDFPAHFTGSCEEAPEFPAGSCNNKLVGARHFAAAAIASGQFNASFDFASPLDGDGHGTHTASTAAGNSRIPVVVSGTSFGLASGMAPRAHIAMYKSLYRTIGGYFADTIAAMDQAVQDGVDILSLSIGPSGPPAGLATFLSAFDIAALSAVKAGVFVTQAAGNSGPYPGSISSFSPWVLTVGAACHDRSYTNSVLLGNEQSISGLGLSPGTDGVDMYSLVVAEDALKEGFQSVPDATSCQDSRLFDRSLVEGRILICWFSSHASVHALLETAKNLAAQGVIILDGLDEDFSPFPSTLPAILIPAMEDCVSLLEYYNSTTTFTASARIMGGLNASFSNRPPQVAFFSSRGPDLADDKFDIAEIMKPDVMAPGNMIWAAWSKIGVDADEFQGEKFAMVSGTSMSTPHVAGIAALVKQKNPKFSPAAIASALTTTASPVDREGKPLLAQKPFYDVSLPLGPGTPFDFGGGEVNPTAALDPGLVFDAGFRDYVDFLCSIPHSAPEILNATGAFCGSSAPIPPTGLNTPSITIGNLTAPRSLLRTVRNVATMTESYTVTMEEPEGVSMAVVPNQFEIAPGERQQVVVTLTPTSTSGRATFGSLLLNGSQGHKVRTPVSVISRLRAV